jgi:hypothetical protein
VSVICKMGTVEGYPTEKYNSATGIQRQEKPPLHQ